MDTSFDWATKNHEPAFITSHKKRKAVLISYDDYCALEETAYLLRSPANAKRLLKAALDANKNKNIQERGLLNGD